MAQLALIEGVDYLAPDGDGSGLTGIGGGIEWFAYVPPGDTTVRIGPRGGTTVSYTAGSGIALFQLMRFSAGRTITTSRSSIRTAGSLAGVVRHSIYNIASGGGPGTVVGQSDATTSPATAGIIDLTWSTPCVIPSAGTYYVGFKAENTGTNPAWAALTPPTDTPHGFGFLPAASNTANSISGYYRSVGTGVMGDMTGLTLVPHYASAIPWVGFEP